MEGFEPANKNAGCDGDFRHGGHPGGHLPSDSDSVGRLTGEVFDGLSQGLRSLTALHAKQESASERRYVEDARQHLLNVLGFLKERAFDTNV